MDRHGHEHIGSDSSCFSWVDMWSMRHRQLSPWEYVQFRVKARRPWRSANAYVTIYERLVPVHLKLLLVINLPESGGGGGDTRLEQPK